MVAFGAARRARRYLAAADRARDRGDWHQAAELYGRVVALMPRWAGIWIQRGHALKEGGRAEEAEAAYREAAHRDPASADARLQLGHLFKIQTRLPEAIASYAEALTLDPDLDAARAELLHLGARDALPELGSAGLRRAMRMAEINRLGGKLETSVYRLISEMTQPAEDYQTFRGNFALAPPPSRVDGWIDIVVDARRTTPAQLRATLLSLLDQSAIEWTAAILMPDMLDHPVASLEAADPRFNFWSDWAQMPSDGRPFVMLLPAGAVLEPEGLRWFHHVLAAHKPAAIYADHDAVRSDWREGNAHGAPSFFPMFDRFFMAACDEPPLVVVVRRAVLDELVLSESPETIRREALLSASQTGPVVHVPRILSSIIVMPPSVMGGVNDLPIPFPSPAIASSNDTDNGTLLNIIIPTRDLPHLLEGCVDSLRAKAARPARLAITIVDNRSHEAATGRLLEKWEQSGVARRVVCDEPFNWSRANNLAVETITLGHLCFVNNDTEMLSDGWDDVVIAALADPGVGAVGARLVYPDRTIQHGGVLFGIGQGSPIHEGVGAKATEGGPLGRWRTLRQVPAVTGAFLCCRRNAFNVAGGFDAVRLPIGFNDIDFCMRLRASGLAILYEPALELIHLESKTRGVNRTITQREWDHAELASFHLRWGDEIFVDPGYNPYWSSLGQPFQGLREPNRSVIEAHIARSARPNPWRVSWPVPATGTSVAAPSGVAGRNSAT